MSAEEKTLAELKQAVTEGHELLKDMKRERMELQATFANAMVAVQKLVEAEIGDQVKEGLAAYQESLEKATAEATKAVFNRFDTLADIMMGTDDPNKESLQVLVRRWKSKGN